MWYQTDWNIANYHPVATGSLWVNPTDGLIAYYNTASSKWTVSQYLPTITCTGAFSATFYLIPNHKWNYYHIFASNPNIANASYVLWNCQVTGYLGGGNNSLTDAYWTVGGGYVGTGAKSTKAGADITMVWTPDFGQWECDNQAGEYTAKGTASGKKYFGMRNLSCSPIPTLLETITHVNNKPTFTNLGGWIIQYDGSQWTLTKGGSLAVYWTSSTLLGTYSRVSSLTDKQITAMGSPYTQSSIIVAVDSWTLPTTTMVGYIAEVSHFLTGGD